MEFLGVTISTGFLRFCVRKCGISISFRAVVHCKMGMRIFWKKKTVLIQSPSTASVGGFDTSIVELFAVEVYFFVVIFVKHRGFDPEDSHRLDGWQLGATLHWVSENFFFGLVRSNLFLTLFCNNFIRLSQVQDIFVMIQHSINTCPLFNFFPLGHQTKLGKTIWFFFDILMVFK